MSSINLKLQVVAEYQAGVPFATLQTKYQIRTPDIITEWVRRYDGNMPKHLYNDSNGVPNKYHALKQKLQKLQELKRRVAELEEILQIEADTGKGDSSDLPGSGPMISG